MLRGGKMLGYGRLEVLCVGLGGDRAA